METENKVRRQSSFWANLFKTHAEKNEITELLTSTPPFSTFTAKDVELMLPIMHNRIYSAGEYIFFQEDPATAFYLIQEGEVSLEISIDENRKLKVGQYKKGDIFGELAMMENEKRYATASALSDTKLLVIFKPDLDEFIDRYPKKGIKVLRGISEIFAYRFSNFTREYISFSQSK